MGPSQPPHIVRLDGIHTPSPTFSPSFKHTYTEYPSTPSDTATIVERIKDADVVITTRIPITDETLEQCPRLKHVAVLAIGSWISTCPAIPAPNLPPLFSPPFFFAYSQSKILQIEMASDN
jgi:D-isomer specific 2-hydroxyacid dehydrogenase, catalytic domain